MNMCDSRVDMQLEGTVADGVTTERRWCTR